VTPATTQAPVTNPPTKAIKGRRLVHFGKTLDIQKNRSGAHPTNTAASCKRFCDFFHKLPKWAIFAGFYEKNGKLEARTGIEPVIELLQSPALPLGYLAVESADVKQATDSSQ
jgi:hypothetical protein